MPPNSYQKTLDWLFEQFPSFQKIGAPAYKPDLDNIIQLTKLFGSPQKDLKFVHIAGTNGKGSTSSMLASILTESGEKVGLFTSPHIIDFRERIRVNGEMIGEQEVILFCQKIRDLEIAFSPSFFEISLLMALLHFKEKKCSICVIETGLGGRLDSTNIITPLLSVITNISLEHTNFLGNTIEAIAYEKGGIIKENVPIIIGETQEEIVDIFIDIAKDKDAQIIFADNYPITHDFEAPLGGSYQKKNLQTVIVATELLKTSGFRITDQSIALGLGNLSKNSGIIGRMQIIQKDPVIILDVSHNYDGIKKTLEYVKEITKGKLYLIYGSSSDKDYKTIIDLFPKDAELILCKFSNMRSLNRDQLEEIAQTLEKKPKIFEDVHQAIAEAQQSAKENDTILVFGSFFLISDYF